MSELVRMNISCTSEGADEIKRCAAARGMSVSAYIRSLVEADATEIKHETDTSSDALILSVAQQRQLRRLRSEFEKARRLALLGSLEDGEHIYCGVVVGGRGMASDEVVDKLFAFEARMRLLPFGNNARAE